MSLIDLASLVLAPTATKEGKVYSAIPDTGDGDMTFTRGSAATRVNSAGLIEKERGNLLLQSNTFDTTWSLINTTETGGQTGYDGSSDAWLLTKSASSARVQQSITQSGVQTLSVYVKAGTLDFVMLNNGVVSQWYDLSNGTIGTNSSIANTIDAKIEDVGNGWYRCSLIFNSSITVVRIYPSQADNDVSGTSGSIYIQDAMLNEGLVAQSYIETTTTAVYEGITDDVPRVDYSGGGCPSLLLEPQRTNLSVHSEYFEASNWTALRSTIALSSSTSPEGVLNAYKLTTDNTTNNTHIIYYGGTLSSDDYALSVYAKAGEFSKVGLGTGNLTLSAKFDLSNGSIITSGTHTANIEDAGNGWYRCSIVTTTTTPIRIVLLDDDGNISFDGDGTSGLYIYGHQVEAGSYVSSYIPTYSVSSTRVADSCSKTGISELIGQTEGTMFLEFKLDKVNLPNNHTWIAIKDSSQTNRILVYMLTNESTLRGQIKHSGTAINLSFGTISDNQNIKIAFAYKSGDSAVYINGSSVATNTNTLTFGTMDIFDFNDSSTSIDGEINQAILFPTRLTNDQLEEITK